VSRAYKVAVRAEIAPGEIHCVHAGGCAIALYNVNGEFYATRDECTHAESSLSDGWLDDYEVTCPLHGAAFDVRTGKPLSLPATQPVPVYPVHVEGGDIYIEI
jgi:3-phenylpropionate/trans-cinnamate dioxygenase ferredoxin subunit